MKKLFISQPMKGLSNEEISFKREEAIRAVEEMFGEPVKVIDSFFKNGLEMPINTNIGLFYLGESLKLLATADIAYFASGWEDARGCKIEHETAVEYGIDVITYSQVQSLHRIQSENTLLSDLGCGDVFTVSDIPNCVFMVLDTFADYLLAVDTKTSKIYKFYREKIIKSATLL